MEKSYLLNNNNSWGWFVDIEAPLKNNYKNQPKFKHYYYQNPLPTIKESKSMSKLPKLEDDDDNNPNSDDPRSFHLFCYIVIVVVICVYLL
jgi:hypothetical protein